jgi:hypothetical protein
MPESLSHPTGQPTRPLASISAPHSRCPPHRRDSDVTVLPEQLPSAQRERVAVLAIYHDGQAFSPSEVYRRFDLEPDPELAGLPSLLEGLWEVLAPGNSAGSRRVLARTSGAQRPFLAAWRTEASESEAATIETAEGVGHELAGFAMETLLLCDTCPLPEACALRGSCCIEQETVAVDSPAGDPSNGLIQNTARQAPSDTGRGTPLWHSLAAVDAQAQAEAQSQTWLNAPGVVERVLEELQAMTWATWFAWWCGEISEAEAHYRQSVEVSWATAIFAGKHPGYAPLPAWHLEQLPVYLRQVYYYQDQCCAWEDVPPLDEVVEGVMWACSDTANLRLQSLYFPKEAMSDAWLNHLVEEMAKDVVMHAAYLRGLVEDEGLDEE